MRGAAVALLAGGALLRIAPEHAGLPCPLRTITGIPCPLCGTTTSVEETLQLDLREALAASPAGVAAVAAAIVLLFWRPARPLRAPAHLLASIFAALWLFQLHRFGLL